MHELKNTKGSAIGIILARAKKMRDEVGAGFPDRHAEKVLRSCHAVFPLRLTDMAKGPDVHLAHNVFGLIENFDVKTQTFRKFWRPRYAVRPSL